MKILTTDQIRSADAFTIKNEPIASIDLMERASKVFVEAFTDLPIEPKPVTVICGPGNNGGDGLVVARLLTERNYQVQVWMINLSSKYSPDCQTNLKRWSGIGTVVEITDQVQLKKLEPSDVVIDAIFGSGIKRKITGLPAEVINFINKHECLKVAIDMPSGLFADEPSTGNAIVKADYTLSFQAPKLSFLLPQNKKYVGEWKVLEIGLDKFFIKGLSSHLFSIDAPLVKSFNRSQDKFAHKGLFGHAMLVAGSKGKMGAAVLSAKAALRGGLGLLSVHIPAIGYDIIQTAVPEAMCEVDKNEEICTQISLSSNITTIGIGPGIGTAKQTVGAFKSLLEQASSAMVIDADGLNILSQHRECLQLIPNNSILTPHPKEFQRLTGEIRDDYHRLQLQQEFAHKYHVIMVYKGAHTTIAFPNRELFFNTSGNSGMATAGSGDVLTGLILGLLTRTGDPTLAAIVGVYLHGLAGDLAAEEVSRPALIAGDLLNHIGAAIKKTNIPL